MLSLEDTCSEIINYIATTASMLVLRTDRDGRICDANRYSAQLVGGRILDLSIGEILAQGTEEGICLESLAAADAPTAVSISTATGMPQTFYVVARKVQDGYLIMGETSAREYEHVRKHMIQLTNGYAAMTRELQKKTKMLEALLEEKNRFIGIAAHDLRNPLTIIRTYAELLIGSEEQPENKRILEKIIFSATTMHNLVSDMLDLTSVSSSEPVLKKEPQDIRRVMDCLADTHRPIAQNKGISLRVVHRNERTMTCSVDVAKLENAISNIISNAIKYSHPETDITITVGEDGGMARIDVTDRGIGMTPDELASLFRPFTTKGRGTAGEKGTGLGLVIAKRVIEAHGGTLTAIAHEGDGSTFTIKLPLGE